jgi:hypothetical protein
MIEWSGVVPPLAKRQFEVADRGTANFELRIVPGGSRSVSRVHLDSLVIPKVSVVISTTMTQIDSSHERDVTIEEGRVPDEYQLLMVRSASSNSFIQEDFSPRLGHSSGELPVLLGAECEAIAVRTPEQSSYVDTPTTGSSDKIRNGRALLDHPLVPVTPPVSELQPVSASQVRDLVKQMREVRSSIKQEPDKVSLSPPDARGSMCVDGARWVPSLVRRQEPVLKAHGVPICHQHADRGP